MTRINIISLTFALTLVCTLFTTALAQTPRMTTVHISTASDKVHLAAQGDVSEMRLEVSDEQGEVVFQSGAITGQTLDWKMTDAQGERVKAGTYLVTVTFHNASGKLRKRVEQVTVEEVEKASTLPPAAPAATPTPVPVKTSGTVTAGKIPKIASVGTTSATITNSVITESGGKIGIGVLAPASKLHVLSGANDNPPRLQSTGTTGFAAGWDFYHGTTGKGYVGVPNSGAIIGAGEMLVYSAPGVTTSLWAGGARIITLLPIGNVGIGTTDTQAKLHVVDTSGGAAVRGEGVNGVVGVSDRGNGIGVLGKNTAGGYAGSFKGPVAVDGALEVGSCTGCTIQSDHSLKTNFSAINPRLVLNRLAALPIRAWNYKRDEPSVRHIGPMAQDFRAAFNLGLDDKHIDMVDANGVTMAAIQGLYQQNQELIGKVEQQSRQITGLQARLNQVERTMKGRRTMRRR